MFVMSAPSDSSADFEEDENESSELSTTSPSSSTSSSAPFSLFRSFLFSNPIVDSNNSSVATAGVVEGEEDEDETDSKNLAPSSSNADAISYTAPSTQINSQESNSAASSGDTSSSKAKSAPQYTKAQKQVVDMNNAIRKAPVKKLKESFIQMRSELAPTQAALSASVRMANEAYSHSAEIDRQLSSLGEKLSSIQPLFA